MSPRSQKMATAALFATAVVLTVTGVLLLAVVPSHDRAPQQPAAAARTEAASSQPSAVHTSSGLPFPGASASSVATGEPEQHVVIPAAVEQVARRFVTAWASHDARPGRDTGFEDAGRRASAVASPDLGADLSSPRPAAARRWEELRSQQAQVVAEVIEVALPDGAPAPTDAVAVVRVTYRVTVTAPGTPTTVALEQAALEVRAGTDDTWRVTALPNA
ncbi:hypothetical protein [Kitasatospora purpeofusca]|uniref:hypothetical protein n=1 Tax=Kitasatospora purpeofusca TaxID=67352 RepID=UPI0035E09CA5